MTRPGNRVEEAAQSVRLTLRAGFPVQRGTASGGGTGLSSHSGMQLGRVLLIDPDVTSAQLLAQALTESGIATVITAPTLAAITDPNTSVNSSAESRPADLAVVSLRLGPEAPSTIARLRAAGWPRVIALSTTATIGDITAALAAGATGTVVVGRTTPARNVPTGIYDLSPREVEVIRMVADGRSNKWIGEHLELSALTVKSHLARVGRKLGTGDRAHMVALSLRAGIIS
ncbi:MAG: LuxR C-terminal-related transcriptional regulator [Nakamurella sp.]